MPSPLIDLAVRRQVLLERLKSGQVRSFERAFRDIERAIRGRFADVDGNLTEQGRRFFRSFLKGLEKDLSQALTGQTKLYVAELEKTAGVYATAEALDLGKVVAGLGTLKIPDAAKAFKRALEIPMSHSGELLKDFIGSFSQRESARIIARVRQGVAQGRTNQELVRSVIGTKTRNYRDGILAMSRRNSQAMIRTATQHVASSARQNLWELNKDVVEKYQWVSTLDRRTTSVCFLGSTTPRPIGQVLKVFRRPYEGQVFIVTTTTGEQFRATPNHPVLTADGWRPAKEITPKDKVFGFCFGQFVTEGDCVEMQPSFSAIADALFHPSVSNVISESATPADFHGDGQRGQNKVDVAHPKPELGGGFNPFKVQDQRHKTLIWMHKAGFFTSNGGFGALGIVGLPPMQTAKDTPSTFKSGKQTRPADPKLRNNFRGATPTPEKFNGFGGSGVFLAPWDVLQNTKPLQEGCRGGCGDTKTLPNMAGRGAVSPKLEDVVGVRSEFVSSHVYNFETSSGYYMAGSSLVKNCKSLDQRQFELGKGPTPPIHINCRSSTVAVVNEKFDFLKNGRTRSAEFGPVDGDKSYFDWLKRQPKSVQIEALGPTRAKLFRDGGLSSDEFSALQLDKNFQPLTLDEMKALDPDAFKTAGLGG